MNTKSDADASLALHNLPEWEHPIILLPIDVFITPITLGLTLNTLYMVLFADVKKVSQAFESTSLKYEVSDPQSYKAGVQILEYFEGKRTVFDIPFDVRGTEFQIRVLKSIDEIPYGQTLTYAQVAEKVQSPRAYRAVGSSCAANPMPIIIPCHRVLASNGGLGGYSGGLEIKKALLEHEKLTLKNRMIDSAVVTDSAAES